MDYISNVRIIVEAFGTEYLKSNKQLRYKCPFCYKRRGKPDNDYKLYVSTENLGFICFKCNSKGRLGKRSVEADGVYHYVQNIMNHEEVSDDSEDDNTFHVANVSIPENSIAKKYLYERGFSDEDIEFYHMRLGTGKLFGRIVVPNELYGSEWTDMYSARSYINQVPKYRNPEGASKTSSVFNLHNLNEGSECYVVEGVFTAVAAGRNAVAIYGCHPSEEQITKISNKKFSRIYCVLDNDPAGTKGQAELSEKLYKSCIGTEIHTVKMPEGIDAADMKRDEFMKYVAEHHKLYEGNSVFSKIQELLEDN